MAIAPKRKNNRCLSVFWDACLHKTIGVLFLLQLPAFCFSQCPSGAQLYEQVRALENDAKHSPAEKLPGLLALYKLFDRCPLPKDSVYARLLHRMGVWEFIAGHPNEAIAYTEASAQINTARRISSNPRLAVNSYYNLGAYYESLHRYNAALRFYDTCVRNGNNFTDSFTLLHVVNARYKKADIYFTTGDYDKAIEEATLGLQTATAINNRKSIVGFLNERAQGYAALTNLKKALADADSAAKLAESIKRGTGAIPYYEEEMAKNYKMKADINEAAGNFSEAIAYHRKAIRLRSRTKDSSVVANDYLNAGNTARRQSKERRSSDFSTAKHFYATALSLANRTNNSGVAAKALNNLAALSFGSKKFADALRGYHQSLLQTVSAFKGEEPNDNPSYRQCYAVEDKNFLSVLLANKAECLLNLYKQSGHRPHLDAALKTLLLTDSLITDMRHEQTGEQSKLYWRNETREFFTNALEACREANDAGLAFYFMEKSRAVLLNDRLNELGAAAKLPPAEAAQEQALQNDVFALQQKLTALADDDPAYNDVQLKLFAAKESLNRFLQNIGARFPAYYQYKYAHAAPSLSLLQSHLAANKQSFLDYFISDTAVYTLLVTPLSASIQKQRRNNLAGEFSLFLQTCSNPQLLNNQYDRFAAQAYNLYQFLLKPLALPKGRVIVCSDGALIPFEALTTDAEGRNFLVSDYSFSYVYSAQALLKKFSNPPGDGNFLGVAPVNYAASLSVPPLQGASASLKKSSAFYSGAKLLLGADASRGNLLTYLPRYRVVAILSHARADSTDKEPILFMADSVIRLSELQLLRNPSTELVVLSACQTNVGKYATGEGVFSLTRGFASAGVPCITATLWKADEGAIYAVTQTFLQKVAAGMRKDEALQAAKLAFLQTGSDKNTLPYYWANMIVIGNAEPVALTKKRSWIGWGAGGGAFVLAALAGFLFLRRKGRRAAL